MTLQYPSTAEFSLAAVLIYVYIYLLFCVSLTITEMGDAIDFTLR